MPTDSCPNCAEDAAPWGLFDSSRWPRRWDCGFWSLFDGLSMIGTDLGIWLGYTLIPLIGWIIIRKRPQLVPDVRLAWYTLLFILFCGLTHAVHSLMFWWPGYHVLLLVKTLTLVATWTTLWRLWAVRSKFGRYASPEEYETRLSERDAALRRERETAAIVSFVADRRRTQLELAQAEAQKIKAEVEARLTAEELAAIGNRLDQLLSTFA